MDFLILRPLAPETGYHIWVGDGGGVKSLCSEGFERGSGTTKLTGRAARLGTEPKCTAEGNRISFISKESYPIPHPPRLGPLKTKSLTLFATLYQCLCLQISSRLQVKQTTQDRQCINTFQPGIGPNTWPYLVFTIETSFWL